MEALVDFYNHAHSRWRDGAHPPIPFPNLRSLILVQAIFRGDIAHRPIQVDNFTDRLKRMLRLRKEVGVALEILVVRHAVSFKSDEDLPALQEHVTEVQWDGVEDYEPPPVVIPLFWEEDC